MKAADLKNNGIKFKLGEKEYELRLNMNTLCELEEIYGDLNAAFDDLQKMKLKALRALVYAAVKVEDEKITLNAVGEQLELSDLERLGTAINEALVKAMPEAEENLGEAKLSGKCREKGRGCQSYREPEDQAELRQCRAWKNAAGAKRDNRRTET